jgi:phosphatidylserine decarboxylase
MFGCNLDEIEAADLKQYASLGEFFYRKLKDGARPVDNAVLVRHPSILPLSGADIMCLQVSPADGKVLHFGTIKNRRVEQVKGITYSLDALLGIERNFPSTAVDFSNGDMSIVDDCEFANVNGIEYSLDQLIGTSSPTSTPGRITPESESSLPPLEHKPPPPLKHGEQVDASVVELERDLNQTIVHDTSVALGIGVEPSTDHRRSTSFTSIKKGNALFFAVIYLAPGDYHRFHSPTAWVVERRRHFVGRTLVCAMSDRKLNSALQVNYFLCHHTWPNGWKICLC